MMMDQICRLFCGCDMVDLSWPDAKLVGTCSHLIVERRMTLRSCLTAVQMLMWTAASIAFSVIIGWPPVMW